MFEKLPNLLDNFDSSKHYFNDPYPHIIIENALSTEEINYFRRQEKTLNIWKSNFYGDYRTDYVLPSNDYTKMFNTLCDTFNLQQFKTDNVFYGKLGPKLETIFVNGILAVYKQSSIAGPGVMQQHKPLGPHRDRDQKMIVCLLYLGTPDDNLGGDLILYKASPSGKKNREMKDVVPTKTIPYAPGTLVIFPNGQTSIHSVGERKEGDIERMMLCVTFETFDPQWISSIAPENSKEMKRVEQLMVNRSKLDRLLDLQKVKSEVT